MQAERDIVGDVQVRKQRVVLEHHADAALLGRHLQSRPRPDLPLSRISPPCTGSKPAMQRSTVVLPQPHGPSRQPMAPGSSAKAQHRGLRDACRTRARVRGRCTDAAMACAFYGDRRPAEETALRHCTPPWRCRRDQKTISARSAATAIAPAMHAWRTALAALPVLSRCSPRWPCSRSSRAGWRRARRTWAHLAATVLPRLRRQYAALVLLVSVGRRVRRHGHGMARRDGAGFPAALSRMVADAAAGDAGLRHGLRVYGFPAVHRPGADGAARGLRLARARILVSRTSARCGGAASMFVFALYPYVYLLARAAFIEHPPALIEAGAHAGLDRRQAFWRVALPLARPAIAAGMALALMETLADYGTVAVLRRRHVHHRHLPRVVLAGRPRGGGAVLDGAAGLSSCSWSCSSAEPRARALLRRSARPARRAARRRG